MAGKIKGGVRYENFKNNFRVKKKRLFYYGQEMARSKKMLENVLKEKNERQMKYVLSVARMKAKGEDLSIVKLKKLFCKAKVKGKMALDKMRLINLYLNSLVPEEAKRFINKFQRY